jgi:hypothetical protein
MIRNSRSLRDACSLCFAEEDGFAEETLCFAEEDGFAEETLCFAEEDGFAEETLCFAEEDGVWDIRASESETYGIQAGCTQSSSEYSTDSRKL